MIRTIQVNDVNALIVLGIVPVRELEEKEISVNDVERTSHVFLSGVTCDTIVGSATYGRIRSIGISSRRLTGTLQIGRAHV